MDYNDRCLPIRWFYGDVRYPGRPLVPYLFPFINLLTTYHVPQFSPVIDEMTFKWLLQTQNPPRVPVFYTLTKIHRPTPVGRPIISENDGSTERISSFVDKILQPIAKSQKSYLKDTTDFINFIERTSLPEGIFLVSLDVTSLYSLYTNVLQEEGIETVCRAFENFYGDHTPILTLSLREILRLILQENSFEVNDKNYLQIQTEPPWVQRWPSLLRTSLCRRLRLKLSAKLSKTKPLEWKRNIERIKESYTLPCEQRSLRSS